MKFVHVGGDIASVDGCTFMFRNPVDVTNRATIEKLLKNQKFKLYGEEEQPKVQAEGKPCSKCGKQYSKGLYLHEKYCKGK